MSSPTITPSVSMISPDYSSTKLVPADQIDAAKAAGWENAFKMTGPQGELKWVPESQVPGARQQKYAVTADNAGAKKLVSPKGEVTYAIPSEVDAFKKSGHTLIEPDGSFYLQNIPGEDPLDEAKRYQRVFSALTPQEKSGARKAEIKGGAKAGLEAAAYTATGVVGAGAAGTAGEALNAARPIVSQVGTGILDSSGSEIMKDITTLGPSIMDKLAPHAIKYALGTAASTLGVKWLGKIAGSLGLGVAANAAWDKIKAAAGGE